MNKVDIKEMEWIDIQKMVVIQNCGSDMKKYRDDVIMLYKKYIDPSEHICSNCSLEIHLLFKRFEHFVLIFLDKNNIKTK